MECNNIIYKLQIRNNLISIDINDIINNSNGQINALVLAMITKEEKDYELKVLDYTYKKNVSLKYTKHTKNNKIIGIFKDNDDGYYCVTQNDKNRDIEIIDNDQKTKVITNNTYIFCKIGTNNDNSLIGYNGQMIGHFKISKNGLLKVNEIPCSALGKPSFDIYNQCYKNNYDYTMDSVCLYKNRKAIIYDYKYNTLYIKGISRNLYPGLAFSLYPSDNTNLYISMENNKLIWGFFENAPLKMLNYNSNFGYYVLSIEDDKYIPHSLYLINNKINYLAMTSFPAVPEEVNFIVNKFNKIYMYTKNNVYVLKDKKSCSDVRSISLVEELINIK